MTTPIDPVVIRKTENAPDIGVIKGEVEYRNVSFSYDEETEVIKKLNLNYQHKK